MHAFGTCPGCKGWGALWRGTILVRRFWLFGPLVQRTVYRCDECDARGNWPKSAKGSDHA